THAPIKAIFAAKVEVGGTTYYPPLLPCVTDFASVPAVSLGGLSLAKLTELLDSMTPCDHKRYDFVGGPAPANYQGLWWAAPAGSESGWGINFAHQGDIIFATWFTYDSNGKPTWFVATLQKTAEGVYTGDIVTVAGVPFDVLPWDTSKVVETT